MIVIPFHPEHLARIELQPAQVYARAQFDPAYIHVLQASGPALSALDGDTVLACGGVAINTTGTAGGLWLLVSKHAGAHMLGLHRAVARFVTSVPVRRLESTVRVRFGAGCRWMDLLGFKREGRMRAYDPDGSDHWLYARVRT